MNFIKVFKCKNKSAKEKKKRKKVAPPELKSNTRILCALWPTTNLHKYHGNSTNSNSNNNNQIGGNNNWHNKPLTMQHVVVVVVVVWHVVNYVWYFDQVSNEFQSNKHNFKGRLTAPVSCQVYYTIVFILENPTNNSNTTRNNIQCNFLIASTLGSERQLRC